MSMKFKIIMLLVALMMSVQVWSDNPERVKAKFDPKRFEAEMEQFITSQAALSPSEAASFFPVYREMQKKARVLFEEMRRCHMTDLSNQRACFYKYMYIHIFTKHIDCCCRNESVCFSLRYLLFFTKSAVVNIKRRQNND